MARITMKIIVYVKVFIDIQYNNRIGFLKFQRYFLKRTKDVSYNS